MQTVQADKVVYAFGRVAIEKALHDYLAGLGLDEQTLAARLNTALRWIDGETASMKGNGWSDINAALAAAGLPVMDKLKERRKNHFFKFLENTIEPSKALSKYRGSYWIFREGWTFLQNPEPEWVKSPESGMNDISLEITGTPGEYFHFVYTHNSVSADQVDGTAICGHAVAVEQFIYLIGFDDHERNDVSLFILRDPGDGTSLRGVQLMTAMAERLVGRTRQTYKQIIGRRFLAQKKPDLVETDGPECMADRSDEDIERMKQAVAKRFHETLSQDEKDWLAKPQRGIYDERVVPNPLREGL